MTTNKTMPLISVIVTNFNHGQYIGQALDSLKAQTYPNLEVIIVDDASTDNSRAVINQWCQAHPGFVQKLVYLEVNKGKWNALNKGIAESTGQLVTLQDADDASCPTRLERQLAALQETGSKHNLCLFHHCFTQDDVSRFSKNTFAGTLPIMGHKEVVQNVWQGLNTPGVNHYSIGNVYEAHGATCLFYRQLWVNGMKFLPGNLGFRCQRAEDSDFNTKMTLLLQQTSILLEKQYLYRRNTSTNNAWLEGL